MPAIYNEIEPFAVEWLQNLIRAGHIADGSVDSRSIKDLQAVDVRAHTHRRISSPESVAGPMRCDFAGWPDDLPVWTGSCPCQPFSQAGKGRGIDDERHLWPEWFRLIDECRPPIIFGEQVASPAGLEWLAVVRADLERAGYAVAAADLCAASVGALHIRQRLYFVAYSDNARSQGWRLRRNSADQRTFGSGGVADALADTDETGCGRFGRNELPGNADTLRRNHVNRRDEINFWSECDWIYCRDGKYRPVEPGTFPLAHGVPARVGRLRGYGNAIVAPQAAEFIRAVMDILPE